MDRLFLTLMDRENIYKQAAKGESVVSAVIKSCDPPHPPPPPKRREAPEARRMADELLKMYHVWRDLHPNSLGKKRRPHWPL